MEKGTIPKKRKPKSRAAKFVFLVTKILVIFFIAVTFAFIGVMAGAIYGYISTATPITADELKLSKFTTIVYDCKGNEIAHLSKDENRIWIDYDEIPTNLVDAFISIEDERFYKHPGIDFKRIAGAVITLFKPGADTYGASTITQQLIKNLTGEKEYSLKRKVQEQWRALQLETKLEKWEILQLYLNLIYLGRGTHGIQAAAKEYFDKDVRDLNLAECACIAGITQSPATYDPFVHPEKNKARQEIVLQKMFSLGYITKEEYEEAKNYKLNFKRGKISNISKHSYFVDQIIEDVVKDLVSKNNLSREISLKTLYNNGLRIYTTQDPDIQKCIDEVFKDKKYFPKLEGGSDSPQGAMVVMDPYTGEVKGIVGGAGEKSADLVLNRATSTLATKRPGSSIKPIAVYAPAIEAGVVTPASVIDDIPTYIGNYHPENYDKTYRGLTSIRDAIVSSINVVAVKTWLKLGADNSVNFLKNLGITTLTRDDRYAAMALGGLTNGVTVHEMTAAYAAFANKGIYTKPLTYTKVVDRNGKTILENKPERRIVMSEVTAYLMTNMLRDVVRLDWGTGAGARLQGNKMPVAGKTGTTDDNWDKWFVGFTPYYAAGVRYGYDRGKPITDIGQAVTIWQAVMEKIHASLQPRDFIVPQGIEKKAVCMDSGMLPGPYCSHDPRGSRVREEIFAKGTAPRETCRVHTPPTRICKDSGWLAGNYCPTESVVQRVFIVRPEPYEPIRPNDPMPADRQYELPAGEYCNIHGPDSWLP